MLSAMQEPHQKTAKKYHVRMHATRRPHYGALCNPSDADNRSRDEHVGLGGLHGSQLPDDR